MDGGGWLLPITGRWSLAPTIFFPFGGETQFTETWTAWAAEATTITTCDEKFWQLVDNAHINYLYTRQDTIGVQAKNLLDCKGMLRLYDNGQVSVWLVGGYNEGD